MSDRRLVDTTAAAAALVDPTDPKALRRARARLRKWIQRSQLPTYGTDRAGRNLVDLDEVYACDRDRRASSNWRGRRAD
jgi:hypothetical protein